MILSEMRMLSFGMECCHLGLYVIIWDESVIIWWVAVIIWEVYVIIWGVDVFIWTGVLSSGGR
jgi:hypothetical protein